MASKEIDVKWIQTGSGYEWKQSRNEVFVRFQVASGTRGRDIRVDTTLNSICAGPKTGAPVLNGKLSSNIIADDTLWTLNDESQVEIVLVKAKHHESWKSVLEGQDEVDPLTQEEMNKKMMLEKFQAEHPGFDFSGAEFTGQVPQDPVNFARFD